MYINGRSKRSGIVACATCLLLPLAAMPPTDGQFATIASWYGPGFQGHTTASGQRFDQNKLTAASRTLPFGTKVTVRNLKNGRTCKVVINDRGPFVRGRGIDLSRAAAHQLGISGLSPVVCYTGTSAAFNCPSAAGTKLAPSRRSHYTGDNILAMARTQSKQRARALQTSKHQSLHFTENLNLIAYQPSRVQLDSKLMSYHLRNSYESTQPIAVPVRTQQPLLVYRPIETKSRYSHSRSRSYIAYNRPVPLRIKRSDYRSYSKLARLFKGVRSSVLAML